MELMDAIYGRRSVRSFEDKPVEREAVVEIIKAGIYAPTACNRQAWKFMIVDEPGCKTAVRAKAGTKMIEQAPVGVLALYRKDVSPNYRLYKDHYQSASAAIQNMLLVAYEKGIGSCWICNLANPRKIRKALGIPSYYEVIGYVALGYPKEFLDQATLAHYRGDSNKAKTRKRKYTSDEVITFNGYSPHENVQDARKFMPLLALFHKISYSADSMRMRKLMARLQRAIGKSKKA